MTAWDCCTQVLLPQEAPRGHCLGLLLSLHKCYPVPAAVLGPRDTTLVNLQLGKDGSELHVRGQGPRGQERLSSPRLSSGEARFTRQSVERVSEVGGQRAARAEDSGHKVLEPEGQVTPDGQAAPRWGVARRADQSLAGLRWSVLKAGRPPGWPSPRGQPFSVGLGSPAPYSWVKGWGLRGDGNTPVSPTCANSTSA